MSVVKRILVCIPVLPNIGWGVYCGLERCSNKLFLSVLLPLSLIMSMLIVICSIIYEQIHRDTPATPPPATPPPATHAPTTPPLQHWSKYYGTFSYRMDEEMGIGTSTRTTDGECSICLGEFQEQDECAMLHMCNHMYHRKCIDKWLPKSCPLCRSIP